jgi:hypothetical protein
MKLLIGALLALGLVASCGRESDTSIPPKAPGPLPSGVLSQKPIHPYPAAKSVRLFVTADGNLGPKRYLEPKGRLLTEAQRSQAESAFLQRIYAPSPDPLDSPACCIAHYYFRYYDPSGRQIGEVAVCSCAGYIETNPAVTIAEGAVFQIDGAKLNSLLHKLNLPANAGTRPS